MRLFPRSKPFQVRDLHASDKHSKLFHKNSPAFGCLLRTWVSHVTSFPICAGAALLSMGGSNDLGGEYTEPAFWRLWSASDGHVLGLQLQFVLALAPAGAQGPASVRPTWASHSRPPRQKARLDETHLMENPISAVVSHSCGRAVWFSSAHLQESLCPFRSRWPTACWSPWAESTRVCFVCFTRRFEQLLLEPLLLPWSVEHLKHSMFIRRMLVTRNSETAVVLLRKSLIPCRSASHSNFLFQLHGLEYLRSFLGHSLISRFPPSYPSIL